MHLVFSHFTYADICCSRFLIIFTFTSAILITIWLNVLEETQSLWRKLYFRRIFSTIHIIVITFTVTNNINININEPKIYQNGFQNEGTTYIPEKLGIHTLLLKHKPAIRNEAARSSDKTDLSLVQKLHESTVV